jgi:4-hydroxy-tetrahydrodipicolinate reductase
MQEKKHLVAVNGVLGRMGSTVLAAVSSAPDMEPVGGADVKASASTLPRPDGKGALTLTRDLSALFKDRKPQVVVDFTNGEAAVQAMETAIYAGVRVVSGSTGVKPADLERIGKLAAQKRVGVISASNFALGAVLLGHLAGIAARYFDYADLIESHHEMKIDSPSGTALSIARAMAQGRGKPFKSVVSEKETLVGARGGVHDGINVHAARMPGRVARHEVVFGATGQTLTIIHDSINRESFMPGVLAAIRHVVTIDHMVVGLDKVLGLDK